MIKINKKDKEIIIKGIEDKGYKVEDIINKLYEVYCIQKLGDINYEGNINFIL